MWRISPAALRLLSRAVLDCRYCDRGQAYCSWCAGRKDIGGLGEGRGSATSAARRGGWIIAIGSGPTVHAGGEA